MICKRHGHNEHDTLCQDCIDGLLGFDVKIKNCLFDWDGASQALNEVGAAISAACVWEWTLDASCGEDMSPVDVAVIALECAPPWQSSRFMRPQPHDAIKLFPLN